jgi:hypothetical protein
MSVVVDLPEFGPSTMDTVAPATGTEVSLLLTFPLSESVVVGLGAADGNVVALPVSRPQAHVQATVTNTTTKARFMCSRLRRFQFLR